MRILFLIIGLLYISGCSLVPKAPVNITDYSFITGASVHPDQPHQKINQNGKKIFVAPVSAPLWLDTRSIHYRLAYHNRSQSYTYANSRWISPPAFLFTHQIRQKIATDTPHLVITNSNKTLSENSLHIELEEFSHIFDTLDDSHVVVHFRASLTDHVQGIIMQKVFSVTHKAPTTDASGAVNAFTAASNRLTDDLIQWLQIHLNHEKRCLAMPNEQQKHSTLPFQK